LRHLLTIYYNTFVFNKKDYPNYFKLVLNGMSKTTFVTKLSLIIEVS
jgi:preprotein translocase subunit SecE